MAEIKQTQPQKPGAAQPAADKYRAIFQHKLLEVEATKQAEQTSARTSLVRVLTARSRNLQAQAEEAAELERIIEEEKASRPAVEAAKPAGTAGDSEFIQTLRRRHEALLNQDPEAARKERIKWSLVQYTDLPIDEVKKLLAEGAQVNLGDQHGWTALTYACARGNIELALLLVEHGADINAPSSNGETPLAKARKYNHPELAKLLEAILSDRAAARAPAPAAEAPESSPQSGNLTLGDILGGKLDLTAASRKQTAPASTKPAEPPDPFAFLGKQAGTIRINPGEPARPIMGSKPTTPPAPQPKPAVNPSSPKAIEAALAPKPKPAQPIAQPQQPRTYHTPPPETLRSKKTRAEYVYEYAHILEKHRTLERTSPVRLSESEILGASELGKKEPLNIPGFDFSGLNFTNFNNIHSKGVYLAHAKLSSANFSKSIFGHSHFTGADLHQAFMHSAYLSDSIFISANLSGAILTCAQALRSDFSGADLTYASLNDGAFNNAKFNNAKLISANLLNADLRFADFSGADLTGAKFESALLNGAIFSASFKPLLSSEQQAQVARFE